MKVDDGLGHHNRDSNGDTNDDDEACGDVEGDEELVYDIFSRTCWLMIVIQQRLL